jgi:hypothetical protein
LPGVEQPTNLSGHNRATISFNDALFGVADGTFYENPREEGNELSAPGTITFGEGKSVACIIISVLGLFFSVPIKAQTTAENKPHAKSSKVSEVNSSEVQRRAFAVTLVTSLADEARSYDDMALRARVLARAADTLWDADRDTARVLFRRAWEAAEKGDAEETTLKTNNPPPMVVALRRISGRDLRSELLGLVGRRDSTLSEEFLAKLKDETTRELTESKSNASTRNTFDSWSVSEAMAKRLLLAARLLDDGQVERALEIAAPALNQVNAKSIDFLSTLRGKKTEIADQRFALLLARAEFDPSSDANTVSGLSSYAFTPSVYVTFSADGGARWSQPDEAVAPANLPAALRLRFFQVASTILLRPLPPPDQDFTSSGRTGKYMVIKRLLPLFDQYAPDIASALRAQLLALASDGNRKAMANDSPLLTKGLLPEATGDSAFESMQDRLDHAKSIRERDEIYSEAAAVLGNHGDSRAQDLADKIDNSDRRTEVRQYVDFELVRLAVLKKEASEVTRLAKAGQLTHTQRAWAYTQAARLLANSERSRSLQFLEEAAAEARRIDADKPDRALVLIGVAGQFVSADRVRAWEITREAVNSANLTGDFTGENVQLTFPLWTKTGPKFASIGGEDFGLSGVLRSLTKDDLYRSIDLAKDFKNDAPRAVAILAIASAMLDKNTEVGFRWQRP